MSHRIERSRDLPYACHRSDLLVDYVGATPNAVAALDVSYSGGQSLSVILLPEPGVLPSLVAGVLVLAGLRRRSSRGAGS